MKKYCAHSSARVTSSLKARTYTSGQLSRLASVCIYMNTLVSPKSYSEVHLLVLRELVTVAEKCAQYLFTGLQNMPNNCANLSFPKYRSVALTIDTA